MNPPIRIAIVGDFDVTSPSHAATNEALDHAADFLSFPLECRWRDTGTLAAGEAAGALTRFHGIWLAPGSPYRSMDGALNAARLARERGVPFIGT
jgi:CTP synthase (UTP-ammonia lyase)